MAVTIVDVARVAGVGVGTVSRVLNNSEAVKESTRQKVLAAIAELNFSPDPIARSMITRRTGTVGVIMPFVTRFFGSEVLRGLINAATKQGYELVIYNVEDNKQREHYFLKLPMLRRVDGLIIVSLSPEEAIAQSFHKNNLPTVVLDGYSPLLTSIVVNNVMGAYQAVKHLIDKGHRRIGFINGIVEGSFKFNQANDRLIGVHMALSDAGIEYDPSLMLETEWNRAGGRSAAKQLLESPEPPTAIFASSDVQAVGVLEAARNHGLLVPLDLSVIGFDGVELSEIMELSTIQQPMQLMGELGFTKLLNQIENKTNEVELIRLETALVERKTTAAPLSAVN
ncbi:MAG: LacI family DNA-binding transcriptional regulator [Chloroflexi bacterium]|uniref:LacI family DNA-binding transcriptional regulator n=1 Tax=Candidatus Chlorohelix allophototropha TaxID=3003348 RepID=A0A8T7M928_9CHLR|nr:LacI family DNA-binding transcriptional regulator [Chloroflexota bacterium]WJW68565.1 LacI family transcriptional regulator [Chloroflexota bacterium L227-S17]